MTPLLALAVIGPQNLDPTPFRRLYAYDNAPRTPILPWFAVPRTVGGWLPTPDHPPEEYVLSCLPAERRPRDRVVRRLVERNVVRPPQNYPGVGWARLWQMTFRTDVFGPDGPYSVYIDKDALVRVSPP